MFMIIEKTKHIFGYIHRSIWVLGVKKRKYALEKKGVDIPDVVFAL